MFISNIKIDGFKNLSSINIDADKHTNAICGDNAQGKTNLIEAIWLCSGLKSFRNSKDKDLINLYKQSFSIELLFKNSFRNQKIEYSLAKPNIKDKHIKLNGVSLRNPSDLFGNMCCVVFTPEDLFISKGFPENRRKFIDVCASQLKNSYRKVLIQYDEILNQRNVLLKNIGIGKSSADELDVWDEQMARLGSYISVIRYAYAKKLNIFAEKLYNEISQGKEKLEVFYKSTVFESLENRSDYNGEMADEYLLKLKNSRHEDIKAGFTTIGVQRDDLISFINGLNCREFGSQGQCRSVALVFKIAQAYILFEETKEAPIILLDDVLSELDSKRQEFVLSRISDMQVFITCCEDIKLQENTGKTFYIKKGKIINNKQ